MNPLDFLINTLELEKIEEKIFRGNTIDIGSRSVFGGQVLAQALNAATRTVPEDRLAHSMHAYFILPGDIKAPIVYEVDTIRDGRSFTTRRVVAVQHGRPIFNMAASFQIEEEGAEHQINMLNVPHPESLASYQESITKWEKEGMEISSVFKRKDWPIEIRPVEDINPFNPGKRPPFKHVWFRANGKVDANNHALHRYLAAYASDFNLLTSAMLPHNLSFYKEKIIIASIDHAMWFHRNFRSDEWLLYAIDSPSASNARGFTRGSIFNQEGVLVASVTQEGLIRVVKDKDKK